MSQPEARKERKVVTVLFADLVGFTQRAEPLDPEDVEAILDPYHTRLRSELERFGGTVEKFIGDAVVAIFGAPLAHEDDPERAVRAALAIRDAMVEEGRDLELRIAVNTGEALLSLDARPEAGEHFATGDVLNTAARLQAAAPVNSILVAETTYRATRQVIDYREHEPVVAKGKPKPIPVWEALDAPSRFRPVRRELAPLVGRQRELDVLLDALARAREERGPQLVTVMGVPGIGKSRLVHELAATVEADPELIYWRQGRSLPYGEGVTFWALEEMVKTHAGILETDPAEEAEAKLGQALADLLGDDGERPWVESHLRPLIGLGSEPELAGDRRPEAFAAWRRFFEVLAERRPLVLVFEDLHWADEGVLDFVDHLVDWASGVPILIVATARPELFVRRPGWGGGKTNAVTISLSPLSDQQTAQLVHALLARSVMPAEVEHVLLERAGGNPLYAEEFVRMFAEHGEGKLPVPEAVQGIIAARLDSLQREEKELLQSAAVVGDVFWSGSIATLSTDARAEVEQRLHALERKEFVRRRRRASVAGETEFAFSHALIREVAYDQIPRARRAEKHRLAAKWIDSLRRPEDACRVCHAELVAHHCLRALEYGRPATQETTAVAERARGALSDAGDRALALNAFAAAARFYASALRLWPASDAERAAVLFRYGKARFHAEEAGEEELAEAVEGLLAAGDPETAAEALVTLAELASKKGQRDRCFERLRRAEKLVAERPASRSKANVLGNRSKYLMLAGEYAESIRVGSETLALAAQLGLDEIHADVLVTLGTAKAQLGQELEGLHDLDEAIELARALNSPVLLRGMINRSVAAPLDQRRFGELTRESLLLAERFGDAPMIRFLTAQLAANLYEVGDWEAALRLADDFIAACEAGRPHYMEYACRYIRASIRLGRDDLEGALEDGRRALELWRSVKDPQAAPLCFVAYLYLLAGRREVADELVREFLGNEAYIAHDGSTEVAWAIREFGREKEHLDVARRLPHRNPWVDAVIALVEGELLRAADVYRDLGNASDEALTRLRAAEQLAAEGRRGEAEEQLQQALAFYRSVGATRYVREGEALIATTA